MSTCRPTSPPRRRLLGRGRRGRRRVRRGLRLARSVPARRQAARHPAARRAHRRPGRVRTLGGRHVAQPGRDDRPRAPACRPTTSRSHCRGRPLGLHLADEHRRLPVVGDRRPRARHHLRRGEALGSAHPHAQDPASGWSTTSRAACTTTGTTRRRATSSPSGPTNGTACLPVRVERRQRLARRRAARRQERRPRPRAAGPRAMFDRMRWDMFYDTNVGAQAGPHPRRLLRRPAAARVLRLHRATTSASARTSGTRTTTTTRRSPRPGSRATSASSPARSRPRTTSRCGGPSRRPATGRGRRCSRSA